ncbi:MAG: hypothetical protein ACI87E_002554 [Mariniblastus sp.]|jgi:hypothetical protein
MGWILLQYRANTARKKAVKAGYLRFDETTIFDKLVRLG